jgi:hypothetical protein
VLWAVSWAVVVLAGSVGLLVTVQGWRFGRRVAAEARQLWAAPGAGAPAALPLEGLPPPVRRYLEACGAAGRAPVRSVRLRHGGTFRTGLGQPWSPIQGEQYFSADPPGFVWWGRIRMAPGLRVEARDRAFLGEGSMLVMLAGTVTLADARGPDLDQGAQLRLLAEMAWYPTAYLDRRYVTWEPVDAERARATLRVGGREVSATFRFGPDGLPAGVAAERYRDVGGKGVLTPWGGEFGDWREVDGLRVPFRSEVSWVIDGAPFPYARWEFEEVQYDRPEPW